MLKDLLFIKEFLQSSARKYIPRLTSIAEWLLAENVILKLELKNVKILLSDRKAWKIGKRSILKERIVISTCEILILFEKIEVVIQNKKKIYKSHERLRKNIAMESIIMLKENKNEEKISENDINENIKLEL
jgi:hypothetical protein